MSIIPPKQDDRDFHELVENAKQIIRRSCPSWTDLSPNDPGMTLIEVFAHMTELMIYKLNQLPVEAYAEFLRLIGIHPMPPVAAHVSLTFSVANPSASPVVIPRGTQVATNRSDPGKDAVIFTTTHAVSIPPGETAVQALACHATWIEGELCGTASGLPGQTVKALHAPIIASAQSGLDFVVGVQAAMVKQAERENTIAFQDKTFVIWKEVPNFANLPPASKVYTVDRSSGIVKFAPALQQEGGTGATQALADIPEAGREIRLWYGYGGGDLGNVAAGSLTVMKNVIPGVNVTNPSPAVGGRPSETMEHAMVRGPHEFYSLGRVVTEDDFTRAAESCGAIARAKAFTKVSHWKHAPPGTVEVLLVPDVTQLANSLGRVGIEDLMAHQVEDERNRIEKMLDERRPLGTLCSVNWVQYKRVKVTARAIIRPGMDASQTKQRIEGRLHRRINPLPSPGTPGWEFGQPLRQSTIYDVMLSEPGVAYVEDIRFHVDESPDEQVMTVAPDLFETRTWYAGARGVLFRSRNNGDSWEPCLDVGDGLVEQVLPHPEKPGWVAIFSINKENNGSTIQVSSDCGQTWRQASRLGFRVREMAWKLQLKEPALLMATDVGLYELELLTEASPVTVIVDPASPNLGFFSISITSRAEGIEVAVAGRGSAGVYLSRENGRSKTYKPIGLKGEDVRVLSMQEDGVRRFLWAGVTAVGNAEGKGCFRWELMAGADSTEGWVAFDRGWTGGSCRALAFRGVQVLAATHHGGLLSLDSRKRESAWSRPDLKSSGLPLRDEERLFQVLDAVAMNEDGSVLLTAGPGGLHRETDPGSFACVSGKEFKDRVPLPAGMLFCSGDHDITVEINDES